MVERPEVSAMHFYVDFLIAGMKTTIASIKVHQLLVI